MLNATTVTISCIGNVNPSNGNLSVSPTATTTYVLTASPSTYQWLDSYALQQQLPDPDGSSAPEAPALWMSRVQHTGKNGASVGTPPMYLYGDPFPNRFDIAAGVSPVEAGMNRAPAVP